MLNYDLCERNILNSPQCSCGKQEDAYHFFFVCKISILCSSLNWSILLCGDVNLPLQINNRIFAAVHKFIDESCRFS